MPFSYENDQQIKEYVCDKISQGITLASICREDGMPNRMTIYRWIDDDKEFMLHIERAREAGSDAIADECLTIADDSSGDTMETEFGPKEDKEWTSRSKLRVETRLKLLSKWHPKKYGEKLDLSNKGDKFESPIFTVEVIKPQQDDE